MISDRLLRENIPYTIKHYPAKYRLLEAGDRAQYLFVVRSGAVRIYSNKGDRDYTLQFFLEGEPICVYESLMRNLPSEFSLETIEPAEILVFKGSDVLEHLNTSLAFKEAIMNYFINRMVNYVHLFFSMQVHSPEERYAELVKQRPDIVQRIPQHYIASFLGITSVSLSRIRGRVTHK